MIQLKIVPEKARSGMNTARIDTGSREIYLHSRYDPVKEAGRLIDNYGITKGDTVVVYGTGLGYHIAEALDRVGKDGRVYVFQLGSEVFEYLKKVGNLEELAADARVSLIVEDDISLLAARLASAIDIGGNNESKLVVHRPSLELLPASAADFRAALEDWEVKRSSCLRFSGQMEINLAANAEYCRKLGDVSVLFNRFQNVPAVLIAAGPSLDSALSHLAGFLAEKKGLVLAVGSVLKPLLNRGIRPHLAVITDPQQFVVNQITGINEDVPLVVFPTVTPQIVQNYKGPKVLAFPNEQNLLDKLNAVPSAAVETGGSVATTLLDIAIRMGSNPIIFVGQDLAFPNNRLHANSSTHRKIDMDENMVLRKVKGNNGGTLSTSRALDIYRKWIEDRIARENKRRFINTSLEGAQIRGTEVSPFLEVIGNLSRSRKDNSQDQEDINEMIAGLIKSKGNCR